MISTNLEELKQVMMAQMRRNDLVANNLSNVNSTGFKKDRTFFDVLKTKQGDQLQMKTHTDFSQGALEETQNPLDLAISGKGFFVTETDNGEALTRNGHFTVNQDGVLTNSNGDPVVGTGGKIFITLDGRSPQSISIFQDGRIFVDDNYIDQLKIVNIDDYSGLKKIQNNSFSVDNPTSIYEVENPIVLQGNLESSNVNSVDEMISLIEIQRQFESSQKVLKTIDDAMNKAANTISKV